MADNAALSGGPQAGRSPAGLIVGGSVSFDRAADFYDVTRALPTHIARKLTDALVVELAAANATHVLEVGIGTGRISRPLAERGVRVCGVDIALRMLARLRDQLDTQHVSPDLLRADTTRLPIASAPSGRCSSFMCCTWSRRLKQQQESSRECWRRAGC